MRKFFTVKHIILGGLIGVLAHFIGFYALSYRQKVPHNVPETIVILTGGEKRIKTGLFLATKNSVKTVFITGVHPKTSREDILAYAEVKKFTPYASKITLDHRATTTRENAKETTVFAKSRGIQHIGLVTSFYHMPRAKMVFKQEFPSVLITPIPVFPHKTPFAFYAREWLKYWGALILHRP